MSALFGSLAGSPKAEVQGTLSLFLYNLYHQIANSFRAGGKATGFGHGKDELDQLVKSTTNDIVRLWNLQAQQMLASVVSFEADATHPLVPLLCEPLIKLGFVDLRNNKKVKMDDVQFLCLYYVETVFTPSQNNQNRYPGETDTKFGTSIIHALQRRDIDMQTFIQSFLPPYRDKNGVLLAVVESRHTSAPFNKLFTPSPSLDTPNTSSFEGGIKMISALFEAIKAGSASLPFVPVPPASSRSGPSGSLSHSSVSSGKPANVGSPLGATTSTTTSSTSTAHPSGAHGGSRLPSVRPGGRLH